MPAQADDISLLFKKYKCTQCHAVDSRPQTAPSYNEIMKKYKGQAGAGADLVKVVKTGSNEVWGMTHMNGTTATAKSRIRRRDMGPRYLEYRSGWRRRK